MWFKEAWSAFWSLSAEIIYDYKSSTNEHYPFNQCIDVVVYRKSAYVGLFYRVIFLTGPALKVLSVGDGKNPTKKMKV